MQFNSEISAQNNVEIHTRAYPNLIILCTKLNKTKYNTFSFITWEYK
jgi:hypothetical protein